MRKNNYLLLRLWSLFSGLSILTVILYIFSFIFFNGYDAISYEFLMGNPSGMPLGTEGGIFPAIMGSIYFTLIACGFAFLLAFATSTYMVFYVDNEKIKNFIRCIIGAMAGIPSIVLGLFGYSFLVVYLKLGISVLSGGIVLGIMIFPFIEVRFEKCFLEISRELLEASYAMGINKSYTIFKLVLPLCFKDMIAAISLGGSFALGATAPILFTGGVIYAPVPDNIFAPTMALPLHLYILIGEGISLKNAYGTALVMLIILFIMNSFSLILGMRKTNY